MRDAEEGRIGVFVAGVQKAGTTTLFAHLRRHPGLVAPTAEKELHVFDDETIDWRAPIDWSRLHARFPAERRCGLRFEATPITLFWPPALARIRAYNPAARIILIFRDPIGRAVSQWRMN
ncbi:MAG: sulfotransferase domain-containing protein, partial [Acetobacteraceae bacterium]|nr:sulfotransferase domain-containing protein [Acetobacteraceae bacterium]